MSIFASLQNLFQVLAGKEKKIRKTESSPAPSEKESSLKPDTKAAGKAEGKAAGKAEGNPPPVSVPSRTPKVQRAVRKTGKSASRSGGKTKKRTGIPILAKHADLERMMQEPRVPSEEKKQKLSPHDKKIKNHTPKKTPQARKNRHGIPVLKDKIDWNLVFDSEEKDTNTEETFAALLEKSLGFKELDVLLHEKKQEPPPPLLPLKKRLARYPSPEETLDLHGFSGIQASLKTEIFLEDAKKKGLFTVRVITGKGLHSDGPAILPGIVEQKILELKRKDLILAYQWENKSGKPHGSVRIYLKQFK